MQRSSLLEVDRPMTHRKSAPGVRANLHYRALSSFGVKLCNPLPGVNVSLVVGHVSQEQPHDCDNEQYMS